MRADRQENDPQLDAAAEELVAETIAYSVCASSGSDPGEFSITYLAGWSERTPIATIERTAALIDRLSRRIEDAVAGVTVTVADDDIAPQLRNGGADHVSRGAEACTGVEIGDVRCHAQDALHAGVDTVSEHG